jgi:hypothetical protein
MNTTIARIITLLMAMVILASCQPAASDPNPLNATPVADDETVVVAQTALASLPTTDPALVSVVTQTPCAFVWGTLPQPQLAAAMNEALIAAGLRGIEAASSSYGEYCGGNFYAMDTSFEFFIPVSVGSSDDALGTTAAQIIALVQRFPMEQRPAPNRGYLQLIFSSADGERVIRVQENDAIRALGSSPVSGAALIATLEALQ